MRVFTLYLFPNFPRVPIISACAITNSRTDIDTAVLDVKKCVSVEVTEHNVLF